MTRIYKNPDLKSPIESIIVPKYQAGESLMYAFPRVILRDGIEKRVIEADFSIKLFSVREKIDATWISSSSEGDIGYVPFKDDQVVGMVPNLISTLRDMKLIDDQFYKSIYEPESRLYYEKIEKRTNRQTFYPPKNENSLLQAFILQEHSGVKPFLRLDKKNEDKVHKLLATVGLGWDSMPSDYENYHVICSAFENEKSGLLLTLDKLVEANIISVQFRDNIFVQMTNALNDKSTFKISDVEKLELKMFSKFDQLCKMISDYSLAGKKVAHGSFQGMQGRHLRQISQIIKEVQDYSLPKADGLKAIINIAKNLGHQHPILILANQCHGQLMTVNNYMPQMSASW